jgi:hypothetical protein
MRARERMVWLTALALALAFLAADTNSRLQTLRAIYPLRITDVPRPQPEATSPTGYERGQHRLVLPGIGTDGYHWIMHTERMLDGEGARIRRSSSDGPPGGREVHWSGSVRWWLAAVGTAYHLAHPELTRAQALERVAPWANTLALALIVIAFSALVAARFGGPPAALFALGSVAVYPLYQYSAAGLLDHHGLAAMAAFAVVLFLAAGGAGWVRRTDADSTRDNALERLPPHVGKDRDTVGDWLPHRAAARRCFIAAGIAGGSGMWISAVTIVPVLIAVGLGVVIASGLPARTRGRSPTWEPDPQLWRLWGASGALTSVGFYLLEYFPADFGLRLEVNHPLYALGWLAGGDLLCRFGQLAEHKPNMPTAEPRPWLWILLDVVAIAILPAVVLLGRGAVFRVADPFLWALHEDYILEFQGLTTQLALLNHWQLLEGVINLLPVLALPLAALLWPTTLAPPWRTAWLALLLGAMFLAIAFVHALCFASISSLLDQHDLLPSSGSLTRALGHAVCLVIDALTLIVFFFLPRSPEPRVLPAPARAVLACVLAPAVLLLLFTFRQMRWLGLDAALWLAVLVVAAAVVRHTVDWTRARHFVAILCLGLILLPFPLFTALFPWRFGYPAAPEATQLATRDIAYLLRARLGTATGTVASGPTTTTWLAYFGGLRGLGTLYWENLGGLRATAEIYGAPTPQHARPLIERYGVTHIVVCSWDAFTHPYVRLARGQRLDSQNRHAPAADAFIFQLVRGDATPDWLTRIPFVLPALTTLRTERVWIFEVRRNAELTNLRN